MKKFLASAAIVALAAIPFGASADGDEADVTVPLSELTAEAPDARQNDMYLDAETGGIWQESNGDAGLQTTPHFHGEVEIPADTRVL